MKALWMAAAIELSLLHENLLSLHFYICAYLCFGHEWIARSFSREIKIKRVKGRKCWKRQDFELVQIGRLGEKEIVVAWSICSTLNKKMTIFFSTQNKNFVVQENIFFQIRKKNRQRFFFGSKHYHRFDQLLCFLFVESFLRYWG